VQDTYFFGVIMEPKALNKPLTYGTLGGLYSLGLAKSKLKNLSSDATGRETLGAIKDHVISAAKSAVKTVPKKIVSAANKVPDTYG